MSELLAKRSASIDIVRGVTAMAVVLGHVATYLPAAPGSFSVAQVIAEAVEFLFSRPRSNHPGVLGFIVLSGFCIHLPVARSPGQQDAPGFWGVFFRRRIVRLGPTYWMASLVGLALLWLGVLEPALRVAALEYADPSWWALVARFSFVEAWHRFPGQGLGNGPLRTVATEMWLYALYPAVLMVARKGGRAGVAKLGLAAFLVAALAAALRFEDGGALSSSESVPRFFGFWIMGALAADTFVRYRGPNLTRRAGLAATGLFGLNFMVNHLSQRQGTWIVTQPVFGAAIAAMLIATVNADAERKTPPSRLTMLASRAGEASYSLYAVHLPVIALLAMAVVWSGGVTPPYTQAVALVFVILATSAAYLLVERPAHLAAQQIGREGRERRRAQ